MPATLDVNHTKELLEAFKFANLFVEELGWNNPTSRAPLSFVTAELSGEAQPIAELGGVAVLQIESKDIPDAKARKQIHAKVRPLRAEHILVFVDPERSRTCWSWVKVENKKEHLRDHFYFKGQPGDAFISKIANLAVDFGELDPTGQLGLLAASQKVKAALDSQRLVREFYKKFETKKDEFLFAILGIDDFHDRGWYASVILNRLMFIYFLQQGGFLPKVKHPKGIEKYLEFHLDEHVESFYPVFLQALFFDAFAKPANQRTPNTRQLCGDVPYLNGGLFIPHRLEEKYKDKIRIPASAFGEILALFGDYTWTFNDVPGDPNEEINPDVLGYIFEKYINQKEFGAYYTPSEITDYLCQQTIEQLVLDKITNVSLKRKFDSAGDMLLRLDARELEFLLKRVLPSISLLDPACGSGAFLFAALKCMLNLYTAAIGRISAFNDEILNSWYGAEFKEHRSVHYWLKKKIITDNLYGVDIMEEATEIAKLRLFMALVSSARPGDELEPLPNIDFNILPGNSVIGLMRVEDEAFNKNQKKTASLFGAAMGYHQLVAEKAALTARYRHPRPGDDIAEVRREIDDLDGEAVPTLDGMLLEAFHDQGVKFEEAHWDAAKGKEGKPTKRSVSNTDVGELKPFHWGYQFHERFSAASGFDAIITNPPWEILKPQDKEFFEKVSNLVTKNKMTIKDFEAHKTELLKNDSELRAEFERYLSQFPYQSAYYRTAPEFKSQSAIVNGKRTGTDINLYKLFTERCFNLLRPGGLCGIVIPSGIYTDLGAKGLRQMLFEHAQITGLFGFENRKEIFEGVHRSYKFIVLSYRKGGQTVEFPAAFMRHEVSDLRDFPRSIGLPISVELIKRLSPDSWSVMEFKSELDVQIAEKMLKFPLLGERIEGTWNLKLTREFDMTNDSHLFRTSPGPGRLPLFEGKNIHQFNHQFSLPRFWVDRTAVEEALKKRAHIAGGRYGFHDIRVGFRDIARNTDERTMIATVLPPNVVCGNTLNISAEPIPGGAALAITAVLDSFVFDSYIRRIVTAHCNMFYTYTVPVPRLTAPDPAFAPIVARAAQLICTTEEFADLWSETMAGSSILPAALRTRSPSDPPLNRTWTPACGATQTAHRARLRAELDGLIAHLYELTEEEFRHILTTFPLVSEQTKANAMTAYRDVKLGVIP